MALAKPDDKSLHKLLAIALKKGPPAVESLPEYTALGATSVTPGYTRGNWQLEVCWTMAEILALNAGEKIE